MPRVILQTASYSSRSLIASAQRCINLYGETNPVDASAPMTFYGTPGRKLFSTMPGTDGVRCLFQASNGELYAVRGAVLYRYDGAAWLTTASLASYTGPVYAADNGISAVFVDGTTTAPTVLLADHTTGVMSGDGWYGSDFVEFANGFFIFNKPNSQQFYITGAYDLTVDALDFASSESLPDNIVRHIRDHNDLILFNEKSTDVYGVSGAADFPFSFRDGSTMEIGCAAKHSPVKMDNSVFWLGNDERGDAMVWKMQGYQPQRVSTHALEEEMRTYATIADAQAYSYQQAGHSFYVLTFPTAGKTWAFDAATQQWAERAYRSDTNQLGRVRDNCHAFYQRKHLVGDWENGNVYELDLDTYQDNGAPITRLKSFQHMSADGARQFFDKLTIDMQAATASSAEPDPQVYLRWSDDGGFTWSAMLTASAGKAGQYLHKPNFNRLGMGRDRVFEVSTAANAKIAFQGAFIEARKGTS
ncbi:hypothetical protein [Massilia sp. PWRC2]|uniref:hypothetical protein n=1 Tax=Massilia sp. PWRC2 TaxID=2804626 RepID=UPI003CF1CCB4